MHRIAVFAVLVLFFGPVHSFALDGTQRAELSNPRLVNSFAEPLTQNINTNQQVQVSADVTNKQDAPQPFTYIVQIQDRNGVTLKLTWFSGALNPKQTLSPAISWSTDRPGTYTAQIFVWDTIKDAAALSTPLEMKIIVS